MVSEADGVLQPHSPFALRCRWLYGPASESFLELSLLLPQMAAAFVGAVDDGTLAPQGGCPGSGVGEFYRRQKIGRISVPPVVSACIC